MLGAILLLSYTAALAQTINLTGGNAEQIWHGTATGSNAGLYLDLGAVSGGDNRSDLIIGAPGNASVVGKVYIVFGGPVRSRVLNLSSADAILTGAAAGDLFGAATAAGNVITPEGSLTRNLIVAAPGALGGRGAVYVFAGGFANFDSKTTSDAVYTILGNPGDRLGTALATADLNNDGYREIIIGAPGNDRFYIINGGPTLSGLRDLTAKPAELTVGGVGLGEVLAAGDVTGDGIADLLVGSGDLNVVYLYKGRATGGIPTVPDAGFGGAHVGDRAGTSIRLSDIDHDGIRDIVIGAPGLDGPDGTRTDSGGAYVLWGGAGLASRNLAQADVIFWGATAGLKLGTQISAGDINRDIPADLVLMGPGSGGGAGELDIFYGRQDRTAYGVPGASQRLVDFADASNVDRKIIGDATVGAIGSTAIFEVTGEGARDIIASVPSANSAAGSVYFTISPAMRMNTGALTVVANDNGSNTGSFQMTNPSVIGVTWVTSTNQTWLKAGPANGMTDSSVPATISVTVTPNGLAPGNYTGTVTVTSTSKHLEMFVPVTINVIVTQTRITIDGPAAGVTLKQPFNISGWALDARPGYSTTGVDAVHVYAYPNPGSGEPPVFVGVATYGTSRPDVGSAFGSSRFNNSGFTARVAGLKPAVYRFVAFAHNSSTGVFTTSATRDLTATNDLMVSLDVPSNNSTVTSAFQITGWAIDRARASGSGVNAIDVYVIPAGGAPMFMGHASYGWTRNDVAAAFGSSDFASSGYHFTIAGLGSGSYTLAVYARSTVTGDFGTPATANITINTTKMMSIDVPVAESTVTASVFGIAGWAVDRSAASGTGVDAVHIWAYHSPGSGEAPIFLGVATYGQSRPDVGAILGTRYQNSGYVLNVVNLPTGVWDIAVIAHSTATNSFDNLAVLRIVKQ